MVTQNGGATGFTAFLPYHPGPTVYAQCPREVSRQIIDIYKDVKGPARGLSVGQAKLLIVCHNQHLDF